MTKITWAVEVKTKAGWVRLDSIYHDEKQCQRAVAYVKEQAGHVWDDVRGVQIGSAATPSQGV